MRKAVAWFLEGRQIARILSSTRGLVVRREIGVTAKCGEASKRMQNCAD